MNWLFFLIPKSLKKPFPSLRASNPNDCGMLIGDKIDFIDCSLDHPFVCEYKGGPACPSGMFSLFGKCLGFVKNVASNAADDTNCNIQSGSIHTHKLAVLPDTKVSFILFKLAQCLIINNGQDRRRRCN